MATTIRPPAPSDFTAWQSLWESYLVFYETDLPAEHTPELWRRIMDPGHPISCAVAERNDEVIGLVHFFSHPDTWRDRPTCYLQDLYVDEQFRGQGVGEQLIEWVVARTKDEEWSGVYWWTAEDNQRARGLYDRLTGGSSGFIIYELDTDS